MKANGQKRYVFAIGIGLLVLFLLIYLVFGSTNIPLNSVISELFAGKSTDPSPNHIIIWELRLPRLLACLFVGGILGIVGCVFQSLFRNPLADPFVVGVSGGATVGGTLAVLLGLDFGLAKMGLATLGSVLALLFVLSLSYRAGKLNIETLLIGGFVVSALLSGLTTLNLWLAGQDTRKVLWWLLGSTTPMYWDRIATLAIAFLLGGAILYQQSRKLNAVAVNEFTAQSQGVDINRLKWICLGICTVLVGVSVGSTGLVGFIGLLGPQIARRTLGNDLRLALPASMLFGMVLLVLSDFLAQRIMPGTELPLGALTAIVGAPLLITLLWKKG